MKFVNHLRSKWSRIVTLAKQVKDLQKVNFDKLYAFLKQNENEANEVQVMRQRYPDPLALLAHPYNPPPSYSSQRSRYNPQPFEYPSYQPYQPINPSTQQQIIPSPLQQSYEPLIGKATGTWVINTVGDVKANQPRRMLLAQAQEAKVIFHYEQQDFLVDGLEEFDSDCDDLQLNTTSIFKADHVDAFDSDYDEAPTASAIFIERLSPASSVNRDDVNATYDSNILYETEYSEHLVSNNDSYDELTSNNNVISYVEYMVTIENDAAQSVPSPEQNNDNAMLLSVIEQMKSQVE
ncbi:hypothetical protein Tco_1154231 [Tanacetum coccineum]